MDLFKGKNGFEIISNQGIEVLKKSSSHIPTIALFAYILGFLITNSYFSNHGFNIYDLNPSRYLFTGVIFIFICFLSLLCSYVVYIRESKIDKYYTFCLNLILLTGVEFVYFIKNASIVSSQDFWGIYETVVFILSIYFLMRIAFYESQRKWFKNLLKFSFVVIIIFFFYFLGNKVFGWLLLLNLLINIHAVFLFSTLQDFKVIKNVSLSTDVVYVIVSLFLIINIYSTRIYPHLSRFYGGGEPVKVELIYKNGNKNLAMFKSRKISAFLLHQNSDTLFLTNSPTFENSSFVLEINKNDLDEIVFRQK